MDKSELKYWMEEYPELDEEEILDILEAIQIEDGEEEEGEEQPSTRYSDYIKPPDEKPKGLMGALKNILDPDD